MIWSMPGSLRSQCRTFRGPLAIGIAVVMLALPAWAQNPSDPVKIPVSRPKAQSVSDYIELTGNAAAVNSVKLIARVEGYLEAQHFPDGAIVKKGDLLFTNPARSVQGATHSGAITGAGDASLDHLRPHRGRPI
jgi:multidrug efflux pump subunit AcrA (membrane-fusion protein)